MVEITMRLHRFAGGSLILHVMRTGITPLRKRVHPAIDSPEELSRGHHDSHQDVVHMFPSTTAMTVYLGSMMYSSTYT
jgi:hypothetical protein